MAQKKLRKPTTVASIAALMAFAAMPSVAMADERPSGWQGHGRGAAASQSEPRQSQPRQDWRGGGSARADSGRSQTSPQQRARPEQRSPSANWQGRPAREAQAGRPGSPPANRVIGQRPPTARPALPANGVEQRRWQGQQERNRAEAMRRDNDRDRNRPNAVRPGYDRDRDSKPRSGWTGNRPAPSRHYAPRPNDDRRWSYSNGNYNWNRNWRSDKRYDWRNYRTQYRTIYSPGYYRAPYSSYYYRPMLVGSYLSTGFYGSSYWLNDPWEYRLPQAYGPYRWIRYFDDVLLVNIHTGMVVDVIHNFFW